jgi:uncharacterized membrane-anchored protein
VLYFLFWAVLRYADLFSGVGGMLGAALMFLLCGIGLFAVARFWVHRKAILPSHASGRRAGDEGSGESIQVEGALSSQEALTLALSQRERGLETLAFSQRDREHAALPAWLELLVAGVRKHGRMLLSVGISLQLVVLVGMIVLKATPLWTGETVLLRVVPIDPRDMLRGDYVTLRYDISRGPQGGMSGLPDASDRKQQGQTVYAILKPEEDGKHWQFDRFSVDRPASGKYVRGSIVGWDTVEYGIESFYVQEGEGHKYEDAAARKSSPPRWHLLLMVAPRSAVCTSSRRCLPPVRPTIT